MGTYALEHRMGRRQAHGRPVKEVAGDEDRAHLMLFRVRDEAEPGAEQLLSPLPGGRISEMRAHPAVEMQICTVNQFHKKTPLKRE